MLSPMRQLGRVPRSIRTRAATAQHFDMHSYFVSLT